MLVTILLIIVGIIVLLLFIALISKKEYYIQSEIAINAPLQKVFDYLKHVKNQDSYNKWTMVDPDMQKKYKGADGTVGFIYAWNGNKKAGEGEQEIKNIVEGKSITTEVRFVRPFPGVADSQMATELLEAGKTKVSWSTGSKVKFPMNIMISVIEKMLKKDLDISLANLKGILEK